MGALWKKQKDCCSTWWIMGSSRRCGICARCYKPAPSAIHPQANSRICKLFATHTREFNRCHGLYNFGDHRIRCRSLDYVQCQSTRSNMEFVYHSSDPLQRWDPLLCLPSCLFAAQYRHTCGMADYFARIEALHTNPVSAPNGLLVANHALTYFPRMQRMFHAVLIKRVLLHLRVSSARHNYQPWDHCVSTSLAFTNPDQRHVSSRNTLPAASWETTSTIGDN
ncbi:hypothetical protein JB92DRAFT_3094866 [Gautieria morchelliformis]|nr:hypothetical protein JB92DRAFT_3094866 [Gautieria morchelliformis]